MKISQQSKLFSKKLNLSFISNLSKSLWLQHSATLSLSEENLEGRTGIFLIFQFVWIRTFLALFILTPRRWVELRCSRVERRSLLGSNLCFCYAREHELSPPQKGARCCSYFMLSGFGLCELLELFTFHVREKGPRVLTPATNSKLLKSCFSSFCWR